MSPTVNPYAPSTAPRSWASIPSDSRRASTTWARNDPPTEVRRVHRHASHGAIRYDLWPVHVLTVRGRMFAAPKRHSNKGAGWQYPRHVDRRIFGLENEYGVTCTLRGQRRLSPDEVARYLFRRVVSWGRSSNVFLENGARLYLDVGSHPEYATPECDSIDDLVVHDKAGERILESLVQQRRAAPARRGHPRRGLPLQEQHRLGRQLLRLPRELPRRARRRLHQVHRRAHPVPRDAPGVRRARARCCRRPAARCTA